MLLICVAFAAAADAISAAAAAADTIAAVVAGGGGGVDCAVPAAADRQRAQRSRGLAAPYILELVKYYVLWLIYIIYCIFISTPPPLGPLPIGIGYRGTCR